MDRRCQAEGLTIDFGLQQSEVHPRAGPAVGSAAEASPAAGAGRGPSKALACGLDGRLQEGQVDAAAKQGDHWWWGAGQRRSCAQSRGAKRAELTATTQCKRHPQVPSVWMGREPLRRFSACVGARWRGRRRAEQAVQARRVQERWPRGRRSAYWRRSPASCSRSHRLRTHNRPERCT